MNSAGKQVKNIYASSDLLNYDDIASSYSSSNSNLLQNISSSQSSNPCESSTKRIMSDAKRDTISVNYGKKRTSDQINHVSENDNIQRISQPIKRPSYMTSFLWFDEAMNDNILRIDNLPKGVTVRTLQGFFHPEKISADKICIMPRKRRAFIACSSLTQQFQMMKKHLTLLENYSLWIQASTKKEIDSFLDIYLSSEVPSPTVNVIQHYPEHSTCFQVSHLNKQAASKPLQKPQ